MGPQIIVMVVMVILILICNKNTHSKLGRCWDLSASALRVWSVCCLPAWYARLPGDHRRVFVGFEAVQGASSKVPQG